VIAEEPVRASVPPPWFWALPGIERIRALSQGLVPLPPISRLFGVRPAHVGSGSGTWTMQAGELLQTETGALEISALVESALTGVAMTTLPPSMDVEPTTLAVHIFRPTRPQPGNLLARARVVNASRFYAFSEVEIEDPHGRQVAHGASHLELRRISPSPLAPPADLRRFEEPSYPTPDPYLRAISGVMPPIEAWQENDGCSLMRMFADRRFVTPYQMLFGVEFVEVEEGRVVLTHPAVEWLCAFSRSVAAAGIASLAMRAALDVCLTTPQRGQALVGLEQTFHFYRQVAADGRALRAEARGDRRERDLVLADINVYDADGLLAASAQGLAAIIDSSRRQPRPTPEAKRILATLVFTDIVSSTAHAERLGDARWRALLEEHRAVIRAEIARFNGIEVETIGDGFFFRFDSPARVLECAGSARDAVRRLGIELRAGIHAGECELQSGKLAGVAVHIAARVQAVATAGEVLVSGTVRDLTAGSGVRFADRGEHTLKGIPGTWRLYALLDKHGDG
jgi:class 3 adenylate cyclase